MWTGTALNLLLRLLHAQHGAAAAQPRRGSEFWAPAASKTADLSLGYVSSCLTPQCCQSKHLAVERSVGWALGGRDEDDTSSASSQTRDFEELSRVRWTRCRSAHPPVVMPAVRSIEHPLAGRPILNTRDLSIPDLSRFTARYAGTDRSPSTLGFRATLGSSNTLIRVGLLFVGFRQSTCTVPVHVWR